MSDFELFLKKKDRGNIIENAWFFDILDENNMVNRSDVFFGNFWRKSIGVTLLKMCDFWLFLKKIDRGNPIENVKFLKLTFSKCAIGHWSRWNTFFIAIFEKNAKFCFFCAQKYHYM